jgi:hypothetical protein
MNVLLRALLGASLLSPAVAAAGVKASSEAKDSGGTKLAAARAVDGLLTTAWAEGEEGAGQGSWLEVNFAALEVQSVSFWPGELSQGQRSAREHGRPTTVTLTLLDGATEVASKQVRVPDIAYKGLSRVDVELAGRATAVRLTLDEVAGGIVHDHTAIAEVAVNFVGGELPVAVSKVADYAASNAGIKAGDKQREATEKLVTRFQESEGSDMEALGALGELAIEGQPHLRAKLAAVPDGFRVSAIAPDQQAIDALNALRNPNGIPALEVATLRLTGTPQRILSRQVEWLRAWAVFKNGPGVPAPAWGATGWGQGGFQAFEEPLNLDVGSDGRVYVADVGNNRVQRFDAQGKVEQVWGGEPAISERWFGKRREYYVAASPAEEAPSRFVSPFDVAIIPGKEGDRFAAIDGVGRVQIFGVDGNPAAEYRLGFEEPLGVGVGGQGFLVHVAGNLVAVWGREVFVHDLAGEEVGRFKLEDGPPAGATALKGGKLGLVYERELVMFSLDGFRHGPVLGGVFDDRVESFDAALDEKSKLWVVTDTGVAMQFKKPGKVALSVQLPDAATSYPRFAVRSGVIYLAKDDAIVVRDALQLAAQAAATTP